MKAAVSSRRTQIGLGAARKLSRVTPGGSGAERPERLDRAREVQRAARVGGAVIAGRPSAPRRSPRRNPCRGSAGRWPARAAAGRSHPAARPAAAAPRRRRRRPAQADDAAEHADEEPGQRQIRPGRTAGRVNEDEPALAAPLAGHQRRAVGQPRPGLAGEIEGRLGEDLARDGDVVGDRKAGERAVRRERPRGAPAAPRTGRRRSSGRRGAASPAGDRRCSPRDRGPAKRSRTPPASIHLTSGVVLGCGCRARHRRSTIMAISRCSRSATAPRRTSLNGLQRALEIIRAGQQRLCRLAAAAPRRCRPAAAATVRRAAGPRRPRPRPRSRRASPGCAARPASAA